MKSRSLPLWNSSHPAELATARVAQVVPVTEAEGPGRRFAVWFQGCPFRCPGCCNPEYLRFEGGTDQPIAELIRQFLAADVQGLSLLGGEPFAHAAAAVHLARAARDVRRTVMIYTGYTLAELRANPHESVQALLQTCDVLVDGRYDRLQPETRRRWVGSRNQVVHFLTSAYNATDPCWTMPNTLEIRLVGNELLINGFPAAGAKSFWQGWRRPATGGSS